MKKKCISVYVSGKITGLVPDEAYKNFEYQSEKIKNYFIEKGFKKIAIFNPMQKPGTRDGFDYVDCMEIDFMYINKCDAIYLMHDWQESKGATMEWRYAIFMNKVVFYESIKGDIIVEDPEKFIELKKERDVN